MTEIHATYTLPADRELWAQAIEGADQAILEAARVEHERTITEPGQRTIVFLANAFYDAFQIKENIEAVSLHGVTITVEIKS